MQPDLLQKLWGIAFNPIFKALEGENMVLSDDDKVLDLLKSKLSTVTKKGNVSYTKANNAYQFYKTLKSDGFEKVKSSLCDNPSGRRLFYANVKQLIDCGISKAHLQNLHIEQNKVIPFVRLVSINFDEQTPPNYVVPISKYQLPLAA